MPVRNVGRNCYLAAYKRTGNAWDPPDVLAQEGVLIERQAKRVVLEAGNDPIDVSGISDPWRKVIPGRNHARLTFDLLVTGDMYMYKSQGWYIGTPLKVAVRFAPGESLWIFVGVVTGITITIEDEAAQTESIQVECDYYGIAA